MKKMKNENTRMSAWGKAAASSLLAGGANRPGLGSPAAHTAPTGRGP